MDFASIQTTSKTHTYFHLLERVVFRSVDIEGNRFHYLLQIVARLFPRGPKKQMEATCSVFLGVGIPLFPVVATERESTKSDMLVSSFGP